MSEDQFEYEKTRERWYEDMDKDEKWIKREEAITEANKLGVDMRQIEHINAAFDMIFGGK